MKKFVLVFALVVAVLPMPLRAIEGDSLRVTARLGYQVGASTPLGIPASISKIGGYRLTPSLLAGVDVAFPIGVRWHLATGLRIENKSMDVEVETKGYHMELRQGAQSVEGVFTGKVRQQSTQWMLTLPLYAVFDIDAGFQLKAGAYASMLLKRVFAGVASDGYLRQGGPTGPKIAIGATPDTWATYDFSELMNRFQWGVMLGVDWQPLPHWGFSLDIAMGLSGIFPSDFKTVEQTLYPIYGAVGVFYRIQ